MTSPSASRQAELAEALARVRARLATAVAAAGRDLDDVALLPVTKFFPASDVIGLQNLGCTEFGESREQEAARKVAEVDSVLPDTTIRWHMIGRIQRNKARAVATWAAAAHSVDNVALVAALARGAVAALELGLRSEPLQVYIQVSLDGDPARGGVSVQHPDEVDELCAAAKAADGLQLAGLMAIPPLASDPDSEFARLQDELHRVQTHYQQPLGLSAGMSSDVEIAVKYGSTCVRVGTALMGPRPLTSP
ncbi:pyridoxal phosphate enzyme (YggS family) [Mycobacterium sp. MAA66]|uniref:YggS family pyridoxal phosphate-dependent enzyme n=1 Tax=Mycobacterium sp. MAA66 TaxID=3156297 RepID=UPI003510FF50